ncbi:MAG: hypothetical protein ACRDZ9_00835 [Acidimicrobiales bacterium]
MRPHERPQRPEGEGGTATRRARRGDIEGGRADEAATGPGGIDGLRDGLGALSARIDSLASAAAAHRTTTWDRLSDMVVRVMRATAGDVDDHRHGPDRPASGPPAGVEHDGEGLGGLAEELAALRRAIAERGGDDGLRASLAELRHDIAAVRDQVARLRRRMPLRSGPVPVQLTHDQLDQIAAAVASRLARGLDS